MTLTPVEHRHVPCSIQLGPLGGLVGNPLDSAVLFIYRFVSRHHSGKPTPRFRSDTMPLHA
jgi:hypothetical protein